MSERIEFIARHRQGERITDLCREFGISRTTGHKLVKRYAEEGASALQDRSSRPGRSPNRTAASISERVVALRKKRPTWGPKKLKARLEELEPAVKWPAPSTIGAIIASEGLVKKRKRHRRATPTATRRRETSEPNELWCMDFKGQFRLGNKSYCYPLTVTDHFSRYVIGCEAQAATKTIETRASLEAMFREHGLPTALRSDNGAPFASTGRLGLSRLAVWLMRLGIELERIEPGHPEQNGRHERMHLTLKQETTRPAANNLLAQQEKFDAFRDMFNTERPHEALGQKPPATVHRRTDREFPEKLEPLEYPLHDITKLVSKNGSFHFVGFKHVHLGAAFVGQPIGLRELDEATWLVSFMNIDIGILDNITKTIIDFPKSKPATL